MKTVTKRRNEWEHVNLQPPIWRREREGLRDEDYSEFYKSTFKAYDDPLGFIHFKVEGQVEFSSVLFVPGAVPWELSRNMFDEESRGIRLYVKRVFINDKFSEAIPRWLTFIRGVVDSEDLPLNVGREVLQKSRMLTVINKRLANKAIDMIRNIKNDGGEKWKKFWENFGKYLKVGVVEDRDHQEQIASLLEFWTSSSGANRSSFDDYIARMKPNQTAIYYVSGETRHAASNSPSLEKLKKYDYEIIFATEPIDEFCMQALSAAKFRSFEVLDANKADLKLPEFESQTEMEKFKEKSVLLEDLCDWLHSMFGQKVQKVSVSNRLTESPALLAQGDFGLSPTMQRYMRQQAAAQGVSEADISSQTSNQALLEINPNHPIIERLRQLVEADKSDRNAKEMAQLVYDVAALQGGYAIDDPGVFAKRISAIMTREATTVPLPTQTTLAPCVS